MKVLLILFSGFILGYTMVYFFLFSRIIIDNSKKKGSSEPSEIQVLQASSVRESLRGVLEVLDMNEQFVILKYKVTLNAGYDSFHKIKIYFGEDLFVAEHEQRGDTVVARQNTAIQNFQVGDWVGINYFQKNNKFYMLHISRLMYQ